MTRFEEYVRERVAELAAPRRGRLEAALKAAEAEAEARTEKYTKAVEDGVEALVSRVFAQARKDGCAVGKTGDAREALSEYAKGKVRDMLGLQATYDYDAHERRWPKGTPARKAQDALEAFDAFCEKESRRIVVYKKDLGMKPEAFERMLEETAKKIKEA